MSPISTNLLRSEEYHPSILTAFAKAFLEAERPLPLIGDTSEIYYLEIGRYFVEILLGNSPTFNQQLIMAYLTLTTENTLADDFGLNSCHSHLTADTVPANILKMQTNMQEHDNSPENILALQISTEEDLSNSCLTETKDYDLPNIYQKLFQLISSLELENLATGVNAYPKQYSVNALEGIIWSINQLNTKIKQRDELKTKEPAYKPIIFNDFKIPATDDDKELSLRTAVILLNIAGQSMQLNAEQKSEFIEKFSACETQQDVNKAIKILIDDVFIEYLRNQNDLFSSGSDQEDAKHDQEKADYFCFFLEICSNLENPWHKKIISEKQRVLNDSLERLIAYNDEIAETKKVFQYSVEIIKGGIADADQLEDIEYLARDSDEIVQNIEKLKSNFSSLLLDYELLLKLIDQSKEANAENILQKFNEKSSAYFDKFSDLQYDISEVCSFFRDNAVDGNSEDEDEDEQIAVDLSAEDLNDRLEQAQLALSKLESFSSKLTQLSELLINFQPEVNQARIKGSLLSCLISAYLNFFTDKLAQEQKNLVDGIATAKNIIQTTEFDLLQRDATISSLTDIGDEENLQGEQSDQTAPEESHNGKNSKCSAAFFKNTSESSTQAASNSTVDQSEHDDQEHPHKKARHLI